MHLTQEDLEEFKAIYRKEFGAGLTDTEALESANVALTLVQVVYEPLPPEAHRAYFVRRLAAILAMHPVALSD